MESLSLFQFDVYGKAKDWKKIRAYISNAGKVHSNRFASLFGITRQITSGISSSFDEEYQFPWVIQVTTSPALESENYDDKRTLRVSGKRKTVYQVSVACENPEFANSLINNLEKIVKTSKRRKR